MFNRDAASASTKVATKRTLAPPVAESAPSPAPSNTSTTSKNESKDAKRKREPVKEVYSQPAATGYGNEAFTQVTYVIEYLKKKDTPLTFADILGFLSDPAATEYKNRQIFGTLLRHDRVNYTPDPKTGRAYPGGIFKHQPIINVRNKEDLITYLQKKADAQGVSVKDLKDGWPNCEDAIDQLETEHKLLVTRTKKDNHARMVWGDDPTLFHHVDPEFQTMWHQTQLPSIDDLVRSLQAAGQKPASEDPAKRIKAAPTVATKKKRVNRRSGKTTNTHMQHLLKDFSYLKR